MVMFYPDEPGPDLLVCQHMDKLSADFCSDFMRMSRRLPQKGQSRQPPICRMVIRFIQRELVQMLPDAVFRSFPDDDMLLIFRNIKIEIADSSLFLFVFYRKRFHQFMLKGIASRHYGAILATRIPRGAAQRTELHYGLVVEPRIVSVQKPVGQTIESFPSRSGVDGVVDAQKAGDKAEDIAVDHRIRCSISQGYDGSGCIFADSLQAPDGIHPDIARK